MLRAHELLKSCEFERIPIFFSDAYNRYSQRMELSLLADETAKVKVAEFAGFALRLRTLRTTCGRDNFARNLFER